MKRNIIILVSFALIAILIFFIYKSYSSIEQKKTLRQQFTLKQNCIDEARKFLSDDNNRLSKTLPQGDSEKVVLEESEYNKNLNSCIAYFDYESSPSANGYSLVVAEKIVNTSTWQTLAGYDDIKDEGWATNDLSCCKSQVDFRNKLSAYMNSII